ncbi:MAG: AraC family transcriptional regulator [Verrucomicrobia bacterium]|nr:AraC family transcriptional regulator [Cytophagales bacterium]
MKLSFNEFSFPLALAFVNGLIFSVLCWIRGFREERKSDIWLGFVILSSCLAILDYMLGFMGIHVMFEEFLFFPYNIGFVIGPLIYFYLKSQLNVDFSLKRQDLLHFLAYTIYVIYHLLVFIQGRDFTRNWSDKVSYPYHIADLEVYLSVISNFTYLFFAIRLYQYYVKWLPTQFADIDTLSFRWYRRFLFVFALAIVVDLVYLFLGMYGLNLSFQDIWWEKMLIACIIYYLCIKGYSQIQPKHLVFKPETQKTQEKVKPEISIPDLENWKNKVLKGMNQDKLYLNPDLSLSDLANQLKTNNSLLSAVINTGFGKNFNDFVNEFRVKEFQERVLLPENQHITLLGIAFDSGFNSKATFNRVFKKTTGQSPKNFSNCQAD